MITPVKVLSLASALAVLLSGCGSAAEENGLYSGNNYVYQKLKYEGAEDMYFNYLAEAESASDIPVQTDIKGYSGSGYIDITDNKLFKLNIDIPASQHYKITVRHCAGGHKENPLLFNGTKVMDINSEAGDWVETTVNGIFLEKGSNEVTLGDGWSWFSLDSILVENGETISDEIYLDTAKTLCNPNANKKTNNIYRYLTDIYGKRTLSGQCTNYGTNTETDALYLGLGKYPALRTFDFIYDSMSYSHKNPPAKDVELAIDWSNDGGLVVFDWHWYAPSKGCAFYANETRFKLSNAVTEEDIALLDLSEIQALYDNGKISVETLRLVEDIDNISSLMKRMESENVTVLWRPLHEASGGWFWWGASGSEPYKWLWILMYERMTNYHDLNNLIWVWNGQDKDWYPGDQYCDIASVDIYNNAHDYGTSPAAFEEVANCAENKKLVSMSECATMPDPDQILRDNTYWLWFAVWNWDYIVVNGTTELSEEYTSLDMMKKVYNSEVVITRDELPNFDKY